MDIIITSRYLVAKKYKPELDRHTHTRTHAHTHTHTRAQTCFIGGQELGHHFLVLQDRYEVEVLDSVQAAPDDGTAVLVNEVGEHGHVGSLVT